MVDKTKAIVQDLKKYIGDCFSQGDLESMKKAVVRLSYLVKIAEEAQHRMDEIEEGPAVNSSH